MSTFLHRAGRAVSDKAQGTSLHRERDCAAPREVVLRDPVSAGFLQLRSGPETIKNNPLAVENGLRVRWGREGDPGSKGEGEGLSHVIGAAHRVHVMVVVRGLLMGCENAPVPCAL